MPSKKIIIFLGVLLTLFLGFSRVLALEVKYPSFFGLAINNTSNLQEYICYLIALLLNLAIVLAVLSTLYGGVYFLISYGRGKFTSEAKEWIKSGISGLLIILLASMIIYTINPALRNCQIAGLLPIGHLLPPTTPTLPGIKVIKYQEIPIGKLTENLLSKTTACYSFDQNGNPIDGAPLSAGGFAPTYVNHDRADCLLKLMDGAQKRAQVAAKLSNEIINLMKTCVCDGKCPGCEDPEGCLLQSNGMPTGTGQRGLTPGGACVGPGYSDNWPEEEKNLLSDGSCKDKPCTTSPSPTDCCPTSPVNVKNQIEHGPISLSINIDSDQPNCQTTALSYRGLDEFRCPNPANPSSPCDNIVSWVEREQQLGGITIQVIDRTRWYQLNLLQQLKYFKEKIEQITSQIQTDRDELAKASQELGECNLAMPYSDLLDLYQTTNTGDAVILSTKYKDKSNNVIDPSIYCEGFNYSNSSCFKKCVDICPDTSEQAKTCYSQHSTPEDIMNCLEQNPCPLAGGTNPPVNFGECVSTCQQECVLGCEEAYPPCATQYNFCKSQCESNGKCILENAESCLIDSTSAANFNYCANNATDDGNFAYCVNNSYICKNGSEEYAGYPDCAEPSSINCYQITNEDQCKSRVNCSWDGNECVKNYSSAFFYQHPLWEKCDNPYDPVTSGAYCYAGPDAPCGEVCPETSKCPTSAKCYQCPCDKIDNQTFTFLKPNESTPENAGNEGYELSPEYVSSFRMIGAQCNNYSYNDDPMTFYCRTDPPWWVASGEESSTRPQLGKTHECLPNKEIPIGQTVDAAISWAESLIEKAQGIDPESGKTYLQIIIDKAEKAGNAIYAPIIQDYCTCVAKYEDNTPVCKSKCEYYQSEIPFLQCGSRIIACHGNSCQQITDYLSEVWNAFREFKIDFINSYTYMVAEPRSDILKSLSYSRQETNSCGKISLAYGAVNRMLSCTRARAENTSPIISSDFDYYGEALHGYCYGKEAGDLFDENLTDNWFCCDGIITPAQTNPTSEQAQTTIAPSEEEIRRLGGKLPSGE